MYKTTAFFIAALMLSVSGGFADQHSILDFINAIFSLPGGTDTAKVVFFDIRMPRGIMAAVSGASLALAGSISQALFRNSLASPSIIGTNTGGVFAVILAFYFGLAWSSYFSLAIAGMLGSLVSTAIVLFIFRAQKFRSIGALLLLGFAISAFLSGMTSFTLSFLLNDFEKSTSALRWILGSYASASWSEVIIIFSTFTLGLMIALPIATRLDVLALGDNVAKNLAVDPRKTMNIGIIAMSILVGGSISVSGGVPFVGLIIPHITRLATGPYNRKLFFAAMINGATLTLLCDFIARTLRYPEELEVGSLTTLIGAPFFIWLLVKSNRNKGGDLI